MKLSYFLFFLKKLWQMFLINILNVSYSFSSLNNLVSRLSRMHTPSFEKRRKLNILLFAFMVSLFRIIFFLFTDKDFSVIPYTLYLKY